MSVNYVEAWGQACKLANSEKQRRSGDALFDLFDEAYYYGNYGQIDAFLGLVDLMEVAESHPRNFGAFCIAMNVKQFTKLTKREEFFDRAKACLAKTMCPEDYAYFLKFDPRNGSS
jgi:hypothetical protein